MDTELHFDENFKWKRQRQESDKQQNEGRKITVLQRDDLGWPQTSPSEANGPDGGHSINLHT